MIQRAELCFLRTTTTSVLRSPALRRACEYASSLLSSSLDRSAFGRGLILMQRPTAASRQLLLKRKLELDTNAERQPARTQPAESIINTTSSMLTASTTSIPSVSSDATEVSAAVTVTTATVSTAAVVALARTKSGGSVDGSLTSSRRSLSSLSLAAPLAPAGTTLADYALEWQRHGSLYVLDCAPTASVRIAGNRRIAAFDLDSTLIESRSQRRMPRGRTDWQWLHPEVPVKLRALHADGCKIVVFTNQGGIGLGHVGAAELLGKIGDVVVALGVPLQAFVASAYDIHRKPSTGMWLRFVSHHNDNMQPDLSRCVFVGDAAGREKGWDGRVDTRRDHSLDDRRFALNVGLRFATPEPYFLGHREARYKRDTPDIAAFFTTASASTSASTTARQAAVDTDSDIDDDDDDEVVITQHIASSNEAVERTASAATALTSTSSSSSSVTDVVLLDGRLPSAVVSPASPPLHAVAYQELVLFVGSPASGKSTFARAHFVAHGYVYVNQDELRSRERCVRHAADALKRGRSAVVDNTNASSDVRALYISAAKALGVPVRCFLFTTPTPLCHHLNVYRERMTGGQYKRLPHIAFSQYRKRLVQPRKEEGIDDIVQVPFVPSFASDRERTLFNQRS